MEQSVGINASVGIAAPYFAANVTFKISKFAARIVDVFLVYRVVL
jgi:hypothetical protein